MIDVKFYPDIIDTIWLFMPEEAAVRAGATCKNWRDRASRIFIRHIGLHLREDDVEEDKVPDEWVPETPPSRRTVRGRVLIKSYRIGSKMTFLMRSLKYTRREEFDWDCDDFKYQKEEVEALGEDWRRLLMRVETVDAVGWDVDTCQLGELTNCLFWSDADLHDDIWPRYNPFADLQDPEDDPPTPPTVRWHNTAHFLPHWDLGPQDLVMFLELNERRMIPEMWDEETTPPRWERSCQNLTLSIDCLGDPIAPIWGIGLVLGPGLRRWSQEWFTVVLFNKTGKKYDESMNTKGSGSNGLLLNYLQTFPCGVFSDVLIVGLEEFFESKENLDKYKRYLTLFMKKQAREKNLRLYPTYGGARLTFRTHRGHKRVLGKDQYARHALK